MPSSTRSRSSALRQLRLLAGIMMLLPMAGCWTLGSGTKPAPIDTSCGAFTALTYSSRDTPETIDEIRAHNRVYDALCPA